MRNLKNVLSVALFLMGATLFAQTHLSGKVVDDNNQPLPGADVMVVGTTLGTSTDFDGNFSLDSKETTGTLSVGFMGFETQKFDFNGSKNFGTIQLAPASQTLDEVVIVGVADIAKDRQTPVAVSTIKASEITEKLGTQEFPEILKTTPSVYATKQGGGYGDSRINIRGFDQRNTAVMINGMPVNDMENGWVYWSNWSGLSDVTTAMQVQRGLGSSKLAISSVGGTINVLTKTSDARKGGTFNATYGSNDFLKVMGSYSTGKLDSGLSTSILLSQFQGNTYIEGSQFKGNTYFIGIGYEINDNNSVMFTATGAPQWHHQRSYAERLSTYIKYGENGVPNNKYNSDLGFLNGEEFSSRRNFYHKPVASLNWDLKFSDVSNLSTVLYGSWGRGGGTGPIGGVNGSVYSSKLKDENGHMRWDDIVTWNQGGDVPDFGPSREANADGKYINDRHNGYTRRASMNSHDWYGVISNFHTDITEYVGLDFGVDLRTYKGIHYRIVNDDLGADGYFDNRDKNNPDRMITEYYEANPSVNPFINITDQQKIEYYNEGGARWLGTFGQLEYKKDALSTFLQFGISQQGFQRIDHFNLGTVANQNNSDISADQASPWKNILGGNVKAGLNYNLNEHHNVFVNAGYYSKQPNHRAVFPNYTNNDTNSALTNEKIIGTEIGYGYRANNYKFNLNLYRTSWKDRFLRTGSAGNPDNFIDFAGVEQVHLGIEADGNMKFGKLDIYSMVSIGDWEYKGDVTGTEYDVNNEVVGATDDVYHFDGVKVGNSAQFTASLGFKYEIVKNLKFDINNYYVDKLYARSSDNDFKDPDNKGSLLLPSYSLTDAGVSYKFKIGEKMGLNLRFNVNNLFDHLYISEATSNKHILTEADFDTQAEYNDYASGLKTWRGVDVKNNVFFGAGRTWNLSARFNF